MWSVSRVWLRRWQCHGRFTGKVVDLSRYKSGGCSQKHGRQGFCEFSVWPTPYVGALFVLSYYNGRQWMGILYQGQVFFFTRGQFWPSGIVVACVCVCVSVCLCVCQSLACPRDNSGPVQTRIAKFGPTMQNTLVKVPIVLRGNRPWTSRSNLTSKSEFTPFWACSDHKSLLIQPRSTKFGPEVENSLVKVPIVLDGNWPRPSRSNLI